MNRVLLILSLVMNFAAKAQNYQCLQSGAKHYFINANGYIRGIRIDSTSNYPDSIIFYPFHTPRNITCTSIDSTGASWLGKRVIQLSDGTALFGNIWNATVILRTQARTGDSWIFYNDTTSLYYMAQMVGMDTMSISGAVDSVKIIMITAHDTSGLLSSDPVDSFEIYLSKNNGFVQIFDLYNFPYHAPNSLYNPGLDFFLVHVVGLPAYPIPYPNYTGLPNKYNSLFKLTTFTSPTGVQLFTSGPGDVYEYLRCDGFIEHPTPTCDVPDEYDMDTVISVTTSVAGNQYSTSGWRAVVTGFTYSSTPNYAFNFGTGTLTSDTTHIFNTQLMPEEWGQPDIYYRIANDTSYGFTGPLYVVDQFVPCEFESSDQTSLYKAPLGLVHSYHSGIGTSQYVISDKKLIYYSKADTIYGTQVVPPTAVPEIALKSGAVALSPNPATTQLEISSNAKISNVSICNMLGQDLLNQDYDSNDLTINIASLPTGVYLMKINGSQVRKLVKN